MIKLSLNSVISFVFLTVFPFPLALFAQDEEVHRLNEFVGEYTYSVIIEQPGVKSMNIGKAKIQMIDPNAINSEFSNHDIEFVIKYDSSKKIYFFTYVFKQSGVTGTTEPLLSLNEVELVYSEEEGYMHRETNPEEDWNLEVTIKAEEDKFKCDIKSTFEGKTFEHYLNFFGEES